MYRTLGILTSFLMVSSCVDAQETNAPVNGTDTAKGVSSATTQLANPAATYCIETGGDYEITKAADGSEAGTCTLADGTKLEAWDYFRAQS